jgi:transcriptional regulator with XRE-family HTH domain
MERNTHLREAIRALAPTHEQRAARLGVSARMIIWYLQGRHTPSLAVLARANDPSLLEAARRDAEELAEVVDIAA